MKSLTLLASTCALTFTLVGCDKLAQKAIERAVEMGVEAQTGEKVELDLQNGGVNVRTSEGQMQIQGGAGIELPSAFPAALPRAKGKLTASMSMSGGFMLSYENTEPNEGQRIANELQSAGYEQVFEMANEDGKSLMLKNDEWHVTLIWSTQADRAGTALTYNVTPVK